MNRFLILSGVLSGLLVVTGRMPEADAAVPKTGTSHMPRMTPPKGLRMPTHKSIHHPTHAHHGHHGHSHLGMIHSSAMRTHYYKHYLSHKKSGKKLFIVQIRTGGSGKTGLGPQPMAEALRRRMILSGYSAHLHNYSQGSLVHFHGGQWRNYGVYTNSHMAQQIAMGLRAHGVSARVTARG
jgi:hypothetical protein